MDSIQFLKGRIVARITGAEKGSGDIFFECDNGEIFQMYHEQDCCENVYVEDIAGDINDLIGSPITMAEEVRNLNGENDTKPLCEYDDSFTWTFYKLATIKGYVTIRWYGESNGYYSESVDIRKIN